MIKIKYLKKLSVLSAFIAAVFFVTGEVKAVGFSVGNSSLNLNAGENLIYGVTSATNPSGNLLLLEKGPGNVIFKIDYAGNITTNGSLLGNNSYWNLSTSTNSLYASSTSWNVGIGTANADEKLVVVGGKLALNTGTQGNSSGWIYGSDINHSIILRGDRNGNASNYTNYYQYGGTLAQGQGHNFWTGGLLADQTLKLQIANDGTYIAGPVGIGTTVPTEKLEVAGGNIQINGASSTAASMTYYNNGSHRGYIGKENSSGNWVFASPVPAYSLVISQWSETAPIMLGHYNPELTILNTGNVGIGSSNPSYKLDVVGTGSFSQPVLVGTPTASGHAATKNYVDSVISGGSGATVGYWAMSGTNIYNSNSGNVGIGTSAANSKLTVVNNAAPNASGNITSGTQFAASIASGFASLNVGAYDDGSTNRYGWIRSAYSDNAGVESDMRFYTGATEKMRIAAGGNVGIGTTDPGAYKLNVNGNTNITGTLTATSFSGSLSGTVNSANVSAGNFAANTGGGNFSFPGNVGIGTTVPSVSLDVNGSVFIQGASSALSFGGKNGFVTVVPVSASPYIYSAARYPGDGSGAFPFNNYGEAIFQGNPRSGYPGGFSFVTGQGAIGNTISPTVKVRIDETGNLGIGTTNPVTLLEIPGSTTNSSMKVGGVEIQSYGANNNWIADNLYYNGGWKYRANGYAAQIYFDMSNTGIGFLTAPNNSSGTGAAASTALRMVISNGGNVGIGTANPTSILHVEPSTAIGAEAKIVGGGASGQRYTGPWLSLVRKGPYDDYGIKFYTESALNWFVGVPYQGGSGDSYQKLIIGTSATAGTGTVATFDYSGNVGIGTTGPASPLHVIGTGGSTISPNTALILDYESADTSMAGGGTAIEFRGKSSGGNIANYQQARIRSISYNTNNSHGLAFDYKPNAASALTEGMRLENSGNVGIGTTDPGAYKLNVNGNTNITGSVTATSFSGSMVSTISAANVSAGNFAANTGGGNFSFPGNVGIGTTNPEFKLDVNGDIAFPRTSKLMFAGPVVGDRSRSYFTGDGNNNVFLYGPSSNLIATFGYTGNVGIGTTAPGSKLQVDTATIGNGEFRINASGAESGIGYYTSGDDWVAGVGGWGNPNKFTIGSISTNNGVKLLVDTNGNVGIGTTNPTIFGGGLEVYRSVQSGVRVSSNGGGGVEMGSDSSVNSYIQTVGNTDRGLNFYTGNAGTLVMSLKGSNVGIGTASPASTLHVNGGVTITNGDLNMTGRTLTVNKINVNTIDPLYNIDGINYASFAPSVVGGVKEEVTGKITLNTRYNGEYQAVVDFDKEQSGTDLWVWRKVVDFNKDNVEVTVTPYGGFANVYYLINGNQLIFRADRQIEISYRLLAKRFDWMKWPTLSIDQTQKAGFIIK